MIFKRASVNDVKRMFEHIRDKFSEISSGAASTLLGQNLTANKVLVSDADGKVSASETDANEIVYFYGSIDEVNAALEAGELEAGANIYCEDDTEFEPSYNITENRAVVTNAEGEFAPSETTAQELEFLSGVTGNVQEQIDDIISARIRKTTVTGTTNAVGNIILFVNDNNAKVVYCECNQCICVPFRFNSAIFGKVIDVNSNTFSQHANAEVNIDVYYY